MLGQAYGSVAESGGVLVSLSEWIYVVSLSEWICVCVVQIEPDVSKVHGFLGAILSFLIVFRSNAGTMTKA